jgi:hypothetical protein
MHGLLRAGFPPKGIVLPVSAVILPSAKEYMNALEHFSRPLNQRAACHPEAEDPPAEGNDAVYFRFPDFTHQA